MRIDPLIVVLRVIGVICVAFPVAALTASWMAFGPPGDAQETVSCVVVHVMGACLIVVGFATWTVKE